MDAVLPGMQDDRKGAGKGRKPLRVPSLAQKHSDGQARLAKVKRVVSKSHFHEVVSLGHHCQAFSG